MSRRPALPARVVLATGNAGKRAEWRVLLRERGVEPVEMVLAPVEETADTYVGNARLKALAAVAASGLPALGDDTGLEIDAFAGTPGQMTRRWAMDLGGWEAARQVLVEQALGSGATYLCAVVLGWPSRRMVEALGRVRGHIAAPCGEGPGLEPCFVPEGAAAPLSMLDEEVSRSLHHRWRAWRLLLAQMAPGT